MSFFSTQVRSYLFFFKFVDFCLGNGIKRLFDHIIFVVVGMPLRRSCMSSFSSRLLLDQLCDWSAVLILGSHVFVWERSQTLSAEQMKHELVSLVQANKDMLVQQCLQAHMTCPCHHPVINTLKTLGRFCLFKHSNCFNPVLQKRPGRCSCSRGFGG